MTVLIVDDNPIGVGPMAQAITARLGHEVVLLTEVQQVTNDIVLAAKPELALVDLSFRGTSRSGLDVLVFLAEASPSTALVLFTQGDDAVAELMRVAWEALPVATALSKSLPLDLFVEALQRVLADGEAPPDPVLQPLLPASRSPWRMAAGFARLVPHAGHAKLWQALIDAGTDPSYSDLHRLTGLKVNTLRNYREQLLPELGLHGLANPTMCQMQVFATRCRPLLQPYIAAGLQGSSR